MKRLKGFLTEEDNDKSKPRPKKEASKKKPDTKNSRKQSKGKDDKQYVSLMDEYKRMRQHDRQEANALHHKALHLRRNGDVSKDAVTAAAYI